VGYKVDCLFSGQESGSRRVGMEHFRSGEKDILIATDILARGIDFVNIQSIINFDCPSSTTDYVHRIGRTGRGNHKGTAFTFFTDKDDNLIRPIANLIAETGQEVPSWMLSRGRKLPMVRKRKRDS
jgi:ATP-dependent RNA helicase DDX52/ROK1